MRISRARLSVIVLLWVCSSYMSVACAADVSAARQHELINLLKQDCGSCHGLTLHGGLGPALTPDAIKYKSPQTLVATIRYGRAGTPMPPWSNELSELETQWLVEQLYKGVP